MESQQCHPLTEGCKACAWQGRNTISRLAASLWCRDFGKISLTGAWSPASIPCSGMIKDVSAVRCVKGFHRASLSQPARGMGTCASVTESTVSHWWAHSQSHTTGSLLLLRSYSQHHHKAKTEHSWHYNTAGNRHHMPRAPEKVPYFLRSQSQQPQTQ